MIWFVGSNPSRKNDDKMTPFYGTRSLLTLLAWIAYLDVKEYAFINASNEFANDGKVKLTGDDYVRLYMALNKEKRVVALGKIASNALTKLKIKHTTLPHPSPRNRKLNDPYFTDAELAKCRKYLDKIK
jgi:uracil-DNA glycosylase